MARRNGIWYEGRLINNKGQSKLQRAKTGKLVLDLVIAEQFQEKNERAPEKYKDVTKAADAYVNTTTSWHRLRAYADDTNEEFLALVTNPIFNHGCVIVVDASYREEEPWEDNGGVVHAGRRESIFFGTDDGGVLQIKVLDDGRILGAREDPNTGKNWAVPLWDGASELPKLGGGGGVAAPTYADSEGF
jgi:hypothetical protein